MKDTRVIINRLTPLLIKAGLAEERHDEFLEGVSSFTTMMTVLLKANEKEAPNYITFALDTPEGDMYELTIRRSAGKTPVEIISELERKNKDLEAENIMCRRVSAELREQLAAVLEPK